MGFLSFRKKTINPMRFTNLATPDFIPLNWLSNTSKLSFDMRTVEGQRSAYVYCPPVTMSVNAKISLATNARWYFADTNGNELKPGMWTNKRLLKNPNPYTNWTLFQQQVTAYTQIFGKAYLYVRPLAGFDPEYYVIPNWELMIENLATDDFFGSNLRYTWTRVGSLKSMNVPKENLVVINDTGFDLSNNNYQYHQGGSRLLSLGDAVSNVIAAYEARNMLLTSGGAIGIVSPASPKTDAAAITTDDALDKEKIEDKLQNYYGVLRNKVKLMFSRVPLQFTKLDRKPDDIGAFEEVRQSGEEIVRGFGLSPEYFGMTGTTFANKNEAKKSAYQDVVIPETTSQAAQITSGIQSRQLLMCDFSHIEILQKSENDKIDQFTKLAASVNDLVSSQLYTPAEGRRLIESNTNLNM